MVRIVDALLVACLVAMVVCSFRPFVVFVLVVVGWLIGWLVAWLVVFAVVDDVALIGVFHVVVIVVGGFVIAAIVLQDRQRKEVHSFDDLLLLMLLFLFLKTIRVFIFSCMCKTYLNGIDIMRVDTLSIFAVIMDH